MTTSLLQPGARRVSLGLLPALVFLVYLAATVLLFLAGPWQWPITKPLQVTGYLVLALFAVALGSFAGARVRPAAGRFTAAWLVPLAAAIIGVNLLLLPLTHRAATGRWLPDLWTALVSPGEVYLHSWRLRESGGNWVWYLRILLGPAIGLLLPLMAVERRRLPRLLAIAGGLAILGEVAFSIATGTNRLFGNVSLLLPWLLLGGHFSGRSPFRNRAELAQVILLLVVLWVGFAAFFQRTMASRTGAPAQTLAWDLRKHVVAPTGALPTVARSATVPPTVERSPTVPPTAERSPTVPPTVAPSTTAPPATAPSAKAAVAGIEPSAIQPAPKPSPPPARILALADHLLLRLTPGFFRTGLLGVTHYLTQGYFALALALDEPFVPMWGAGHSMFLSRQVERVPGFAGFARRSYPARIEKDGWDAYGRWSSVFPWWASDVGFAGALAIVALVAAGFVASWRDLLAGTSNPFAAAAFAQFALFLAYVPANNQCLQSGESLTAFWSMVIAWLAFRGRGAAG